MNQDQYQALLVGIEPDRSIDVHEYLVMLNLRPDTERTLVYGYTADRETFHTYVEGCEIHRVVYDSRGKILDYGHDRKWVDARDLAPTKRIYPERSDYWFCLLLKGKGVHVSLTNYPALGEPAPAFGKFHGKRPGVELEA